VITFGKCLQTIIILKILYDSFNAHGELSALYLVYRSVSDQIFFESRGPVVHDTGETSGRWELTCTGPGSRMNEISRLVSQSDIIKQMSKEARIKKTDMQIEATEIKQDSEESQSKN